jgi:hypothetical protein
VTLFCPNPRSASADELESMRFTIELYSVQASGDRIGLLATRCHVESLGEAKLAAWRLIDATDQNNRPNGFRVRDDMGAVVVDWSADARG